ncbi:CubicO group peptidase, beta-lactamase class C family [Altererythrobacter xiamenensis]|uniref:CubicO group peptidase, beta-lactamase class C family n=1 Tax=Altererythrobacter xiamenensis TaxID=1316679 RepID=A0A1Y6EGN7_9SPHN|nr:serine hydrolase domain-containing protein [Altererythrobacter xiamenensis]SMQ59313.1 CubicO group peptidase, beta-lactamase class C family [Altererythrobacter xiamenensis]
MAFRDFSEPVLSRRALFRSSAYVAAGGALATLPFGRALLAHDVSSNWPNIAAAVEEYVSSGKVANMVAAFGWQKQDPHTVARGETAFNSGVDAGLDTLYRIYSMTKPITGMAAMMLVDEGKLGLDQPLADILPAYSNMMVQKTYDGAITPDNLEPAKRPITIRQLLTHTAGLGYGIVQNGPIKTAYERAGLVPGQVSRLPIPGLGRGNPVESLEAFADGLAEFPLVYQPGTKWSYSVSLDLLGRVIEVVEKKPFDQVLKERLFDPCGMDSTYFRVPRSEIGRFTDNYGIMAGVPLPLDPARSSIYLDDPAFPFGGAGLVSSPRDYDRFLKMLLGFGVIDGKRVMGELAVRVGTSNLLPKTASLEGTWMEGQGFGAGGRVTGTAFGWGGAAGTAAFVDYGSGLRAGLFTQYMPSESYSIQREFPDIVLKDLQAMNGGNR